MALKDQNYGPTRPPLFAVFHKGRFLTVFEGYEAAKRWPGPRGLECAELDVVMYIPAPQGVTRMTFNEQTEQWSVAEQDDVA